MSTQKTHTKPVITVQAIRALATQYAEQAHALWEASQPYSREHPTYADLAGSQRAYLRASEQLARAASWALRVGGDCGSQGTQREAPDAHTLSATRRAIVIALHAEMLRTANEAPRSADACRMGARLYEVSPEQYARMLDTERVAAAVIAEMLARLLVNDAEPDWRQIECRARLAQGLPALRIIRQPTIGCYGFDQWQRHWATWSGPATTCALCGATITRGWTRALSDEAMCSAHIEYVAP